MRPSCDLGFYSHGVYALYGHVRGYVPAAGSFLGDLTDRLKLTQKAAYHNWWFAVFVLSKFYIYYILCHNKYIK